jgi:glycosyltransferase involved in cell wall biosynthesis
VRIVIDYRPALRARTGVGEYMHELVRAYTAAHDDQVSVFTSSWNDRPAPALGDELRARVIDRQVPVRVLNYLWHRVEWPPIETVAGAADVVHAAHPLMIPARAAARVVTFHDLFFLTNPEQTRAEVRRDYAALAGDHARRAEAIVTPSQYTKALVVSRFRIDPDRVYPCPFGAPRWNALGRGPNVPGNGYLLFVGTLEPRKNLGTLLDAYTEVLRRIPGAPRLVVAGAATADAAPWLARMADGALQGRVEHIGYFAADHREALYAGARALVMPSLDEGFGIPALEAMSAGVPVIASNRGSLPEVIATGGSLLDATDVDGFAAAIARVVTDDDWAAECGRAGLARAQAFTWSSTVRLLRQAYVDAVGRRQNAS